MPVRLRLQRFGRKHLPFYRIVAADAKSPRDGKFLERVGNYNPLPDKFGVKEIRVNVERARYWILKGAQPTERVSWLFGKVGILPPKPVPVPNPETYQVPKSIIRDRKKKKKEENAVWLKTYKEKVAARRKAAQDIRDARKENRKQIKISKELEKATREKQRNASA